MQINLGSFMCSLCSVVFSIILQRILGLFLPQNLYLQPFAQSAEFQIHKSSLEPCGHRWAISFRMLSVQVLPHGIASHLSLHLPQEKKFWSVLHTNCYYSTATHNLSQTAYTAHKIILLFNDPTDTLWKKTFTSCLGSWSLVFLLY